MRGSLNLRVVEMLRLETETSYGLRSSTRVTNCFFLKKTETSSGEWWSSMSFQGQCLLNEHEETCGCGRENSHMSDILLSNCSGQYKNQRISESWCESHWSDPIFLSNLHIHQRSAVVATRYNFSTELLIPGPESSPPRIVLFSFCTTSTDWQIWSYAHLFPRCYMPLMSFSCSVIFVACHLAYGPSYSWSVALSGTLWASYIRRG